MAQAFKNLVELCSQSCEKHATRDLFGTKAPDGSFSWITYGAFKQLVDKCRAGLSQLGVTAGDKVAIIANNSVEWAALGHATWSLGAIFVPMYEVQPAEEWKFILGDASAKVAIAATPAIVSQLSEMKPELPNLQAIIGLDLPASDPESYAHLLSVGSAHPTPAVSPASDDICGFIYTSGTTGAPKGVMLSHGNICADIAAVCQLFEFGPQDRSLSFLYWAHSFGQTGELHTFLSRGCAMALNDEIPNLIANLAVVKPTILLAVPRIFNRLYERVNLQMQQRPAPIRALFTAGLTLSGKRKRGEPLGLKDRLVLALADRLVFSKVRSRVGGRLRFAISGSAALNKEVAEFVTAIGIDVYEGYGLTETSPVISVNYPGHWRIGSVGKPLPGVTVTIEPTALADVSSSSDGDTNKRGEIVVKGPIIMKGYHNRPQETAAVMTADGGFRTGDLGHLDSEGYLFITGRVKEQFKLENGKYVVPSPLEEILKLSPYVANVMLCGANRPHTLALVVPALENLEHWAKQEGVTLGDVTLNARVISLIQGEIKQQAAQFKSYERPRNVVLIAEDFSIENGLLTPSLKLKRDTAAARYQDVIDAAYAKVTA